MKRVLHISKYYYPFRGGTEQIAQDCVRALSDAYEQKVICFNDAKNDVVDNVDGIDVVRCGSLAKVASQGISASYGKTLKKVMREFDPTIVVFHYPNPFVARYLLKHLPAHAKLAIYWHLDIVKQKRLARLFEGQNQRLVERADVLIATSPTYVEGSRFLSSAHDKCKVVPNCINVQRLQPTPEIEEMAKRIRKQNEGKTVCVAVGRHTEYKGFKYLIRAAHLLDDSFQFYITGKGEETENLKAEAQGDAKIHFLGLVDDTELKAYLTAMDVFCFPSITKNEAFGLALAEAMYYGKPAVTFTVPGSGVNYVCRDGKEGIEVPNRDVNAYAQALKTLADNPDLRETLGSAGKERVEQNFLDEQFAHNIRVVIDAL